MAVAAVPLGDLETEGGAKWLLGEGASDDAVAFCAEFARNASDHWRRQTMFRQRRMMIERHTNG